MNINMDVEWSKKRKAELYDEYDENDDDEYIEDELKNISEKVKKIKNKRNDVVNQYGSSSKVYARDNHIYFYANVSKDTVYKLNDMIIKINHKYRDIKNKNPSLDITPKPIYLHINSYGGGVFAAFTAIDFIKKSEIPVHTIIEGASASAATLISIVGEKRYMCKNASMLIHQLSSWTQGKMNELEDEFYNLGDMMEHIKKIYIDHSKLKKAELTKMLKHDRWWDYDKCLKCGLFDEEWK
jgi:ATP-dependent protease ClpP protease subunit